MKNIWLFTYVIFAPITVYSGYSEMSPNAVAGTNADWFFIAVTFIGCAIFPAGAVAFGLAYSRKEAMPTPTWDRHPFGWWSDTLQPLRISLIYSVLYAIGAAIALPTSDHKGRMIFFFLSAIAAGLFVGERIVYVIYRKKIGA